MSLSRVKVWNPGDVLTASDLNGEFNNVLNNPVSLVSPTTGPINFNLQAHTGLLPSVITASSATTGQVLVVTSSATVPSFISAIPADSRVRGLQGLISSQSGTFSADTYVQRSSDGLRAWSVTATSSFSASVGTAGPAANGRDVAAAFASTYVHWYAITTGPGSTAPAGLVSTNPPSVGPAALPTGYLGWTYLGASLYSSSSTTCPNDHRFRGNMAYYDTQFTAVSNGQSTVEAAISLANIIPSNAGKMLLRVQYITAHPDIQTIAFRYQTGANYDINTLSASAALTAVNRDLAMPQISQQFIYILSSQFAAAGDALQVHVHAYSLPNGDG